jgi:hypothetical protein
MSVIEKIIEEARSLPVEERVDSLLRTLNTPEPEIDIEWGKVAENRLTELKAGRVKAVSGNRVIKNMQARLKR